MRRAWRCELEAPLPVQRVTWRLTGWIKHQRRSPRAATGSQLNLQRFEIDRMCQTEIHCLVGKNKILMLVSAKTVL